MNSTTIILSAVGILALLATSLLIFSLIDPMAGEKRKELKQDILQVTQNMLTCQRSFADVAVPDPDRKYTFDFDGIEHVVHSSADLKEAAELSLIQADLFNTRIVELGFKPIRYDQDFIRLCKAHGLVSEHGF